jgi:hypothetical protein
LSEAVADLDGVSNEDLDSITRQKLILDAVYGLGVDDHVTTQYYLHGDVAVKGKARNRSGNATLRLPRHLGSDLPTAERMYSYFTDDRDEYVISAIETDTFEWLRDYYERRDDVPFRDVYLAGLPIYSTLHRIRSAAIERNPELVPERPTEAVVTRDATLKRALSRYPIFQDVLPYVTEFETAARPVLEWIESTDWESPTADFAAYDLVDHLYRLFYEGVWKAVGQQMSFNTVDGPSAPSTRDRRRREIAGQKSVFKLELDRLRMESNALDVAVEADVGRLPDLGPVDVGPDPVVPEGDVEAVPSDDPAFSVLD